MRFLPHLIFLSVLAGSGAALAQSSPGPDNTSVQAANAETATADAAPSPSATAPVEPPSLIPPNILPAPASLPKAPAAPELDLLNSYFKSTSLGKAADEHRLHLQMVALETRIRNDEDLHALRAAALRAPTDLERRHGLEEYYGLYFGKLRALASTPELKTYLNAQEAAHKLLLLQPRVRHETDEAKARALGIASQGAATALPTPAQAKASRVVQP
ncbi:MAG TPA: hypothetical protein VGL24_02815 [Chthoniobacterales bacterium]|jgi:hypothetical protein